MSAPKQKYSSVLRLRKLKTAEQILGAGEHNLRTKQPPNADPSRKPDTPLVGPGKTTLELVNQRIRACGIQPRKNAVLAYEIMVSAGPKFFKNLTPEQRHQWTTNSIAFIRKTFDHDNVVHAIVHDDETTPHLHLIVVPIRKGKKRKWKLNSKGILEQRAGERDLGPLDRAAAEFRLSDLIKPAKLIARLTARKTKKTSPVIAFLAAKFTAESLAVLRDRKVSLATKRKVLIKGLNRILAQANPVYDPTVFAGVQLSPDTQQLLNSNPVGDDLYRLNRHLLSDALKDCFQQLKARPIGSPTYPFMHRLQKEYFDLCKAIDPQISQPMYRAKMSHTVLAEFYQRLEQEVKEGDKLLKEIAVTPPSQLDALNPRGFADRESQRIRSLIEPLLAKAQEATLLRVEVEKTKNAVHLVNQSYAPEQNVLQADNKQLRVQNESLQNQNAELLKKLRTVPLAEVMQKLAFPQPVPGNENQFRLPDDRVIEITGQGFKEITGRYGLGKMSNRQSSKGAIDLVMFATGWEMPATRRWLQMEFGSELLCTSVADLAREEAAEQLKQPVSAAESEQIKDPAAAFHRPDDKRWPELRDRIVTEFELPPHLIDDLHVKKIIHANQFGSLVCMQHDANSVPVTAIVQAVKSQAGPGSPVEIEISPAGFPFTIGNQTTEKWVFTATPLDALAHFAALNGNACLFVTNKIPTNELLAQIRQHADGNRQPVSLAFQSDNTFADKLKRELTQAQIPFVVESLLTPAIMRATKAREVITSKAKNSIQTLPGGAPLGTANETAWPSLLEILVRKFHLNEQFLCKRHKEEVLWATSTNTLAVARTDWDLKDKSTRGVTLLDLENLERPPQILVPDADGVFWLGHNLSAANVIVGVANPLEALSYRALFALDPTAGEFGLEKNASPLIICLDGDLPSPRLLNQIQATGKSFHLATNTDLNANQIGQKYPQLVNGATGRLVDWIVLHPVSRDIPDTNRNCAWNDILAEKIQKQSPQSLAPGR
jgi:hypothetical protein